MTVENPFGVRNPEQLDHEYIARHFVDIYTDLPSIREQNNTFISGARGTGKSMLLRSLEPRVQISSDKAVSLQDLPFLAIHVPLKKAEFAPPEFKKLTGFAAVAIGEHLLCQQVMYRIIAFLMSLEEDLSENSRLEFINAFEHYTELSGGDTDRLSAVQGEASFSMMASCVEREIINVRQFYSRSVMKSHPPEYDGPLSGFLGYIVPLCRVIAALPEFNKPNIFLMVDDADNLPMSLQRVLNSWVSTRSTDSVCLKISTQLGYGTYRTLDGRVIESPHDFSEVNISTLYTNDANKYFKKVERIAARRLELAGIRTPVGEFFPQDTQQLAKLEKVKDKIRADFEKGDTNRYGGATRVNDAITRFSVPMLMSQLAGGSRSSHTYSYAGFDSLVNLSSGVIRWFLDPASRMFDEMVSLTKEGEITHIAIGVQDKVIKDWSEEFVLKLVRSYGDSDASSVLVDEDSSLHAIGHEGHQYDDLRTLLDSLGEWFRHRLLDPAHGERKVFSFVLSGHPSERLSGILGLAVRRGYLQLTSSAPKERVGQRRPRYILAKRLGPHYKLDISGYAAHPTVTAPDLEVAISSPKKFVALREHKAEETQQLSIEF